MKKAFGYFLISGFSLLSLATCAQPLQHKNGFTKADTLRGSITPERAWWDVVRYDIEVTPDYKKRSIKGKNTITYKVLEEQDGTEMQIDLQHPMKIDAISIDGKTNYATENWRRLQGTNAWFVKLPKGVKHSEQSLTVFYSGTPRPALNPPWDGGWIWTKDALGRPWMSVACQGLGASVWYPCKDHQSDEPDKGASLIINVPDTLVAVANGKLINKEVKNKVASYKWEVTSPINNYNIVPYIGHYLNFNEAYSGEKGILNCDYWVLDYNLAKAKVHFRQVPQTLKALEHWFGPYPFYQDNYKLVEAPHLGMEHQSAVAYGNRYMNGYMGVDLSGSGWGKNWDYIIVHESGHEWFGNNITTKDIADMWVHEGFTDYSETLFVEYYYGKEAGSAYVQGLRKNISNDKPIIGSYGVNQEGSGDMYYKGANLIHTIRQLVNDDEKFRNILRGLNDTFYHKTVTTEQVEAYISKKAGIDLSRIFDQYLRTTDIPVLELSVEKGVIKSRWVNCVDGFAMPVRLFTGKDRKQSIWINPQAKEWTSTRAESITDPKAIEVDKNFYIRVKK